MADTRRRGKMVERKRGTAGETRRDFLKTAGRSALLLSAASFSPFGAFFPMKNSLAASVPDHEIAVGIMAPSHCAAPYAFASVKDLFAKHGANVRIEYYQDMLEIAKDIISGKIQAGQLISPLFLSMHFRSAIFKDTGVPMVTPMFTGTNGGALVVAKDSPAASLEDLGGMTIGSHSKLTIHYLLMMNIIKSENIKLAKPVNLEIFPLKEMIPNLKAGAIDGFIMPEPISAVAEAKGVGRVLQLTKDIWPGHPCCLLAARRSFADENPEVLNALGMAVLEAALFADDPGNRGQFIDTVMETEAYGKMPKPVLQKAFAAGRADFSAFPYRSSAAAVAYLMKRFMLLPGKVSQEQVVEPFMAPQTRELYAALGADEPPVDSGKVKLLGKEMTF